MSELKAITSVFNIEIEKIDPNPDQPRKHFSQESLNDLAESIRRYGVMQPITVVRRESQTADGGITTRYEIIAGERRWRASIVAGMASIPAIVREAEETEQERFELSILENLQREDLNPVDKARSFARLADEFGMKHAEIADKLGKSREYVTNALRLLALPENVLDGLSGGDISEGHTRPLLTLKDKPDELQVLFNEIKAKGLTVRDAEKTARELTGKRKTNRYNPNQSVLDPEMESLQQELSKSLGTQVSIDKKEKGGKLTIDFFSRDDLKKLLSMVGTSGMADSVAQMNIEKYDNEAIAGTPKETVTENPTTMSNNNEVQVTQEVFETKKEEATEVTENTATPTETYDEPVILNEYIIPKEELEVTEESPVVSDDVLGEQLRVEEKVEESQVAIEQVSSTDTIDLVGTTSELISTTSNNTTDTKNSTKFDDGFTITPQARELVLDESLAHRDIITQSAHKTESIDRGIGMNQTVNPAPMQSNRAAEIQAEIDALAGAVVTGNETEENHLIKTNEPKHLDLGDMELHEPEFRKPDEQANVVNPVTEDHILSDPVRSESGAVIDSVFGSSDDFVPKNNENEMNYDAVSVAGDDFNPNTIANTTPDLQPSPDEQPTAQATMGGLGGGNLANNSPTGPGVTEKYPQGDPYRLDNFSL